MFLRVHSPCLTSRRNEAQISLRSHLELQSPGPRSSTGTDIHNVQPSVFSLSLLQNHEHGSRPITAVEAQLDPPTARSLLKCLFESIPIPITIYIAATVISLALALWWTIAHGDISGGFTMSAYVWGVIIFPTGYWHWSLRSRNAQRGNNTELHPMLIQD